MSMEKTEAVYLVDNTHYVHLKETERGFAFAVFALANKALFHKGEISQQNLTALPARSPITAARSLALQESGLAGNTMAAVALKTLTAFKESDVYRRQIWEPETLPSNDIRFIDSDYNTLFFLPSGGSIEVQFPDRRFSVRCEYLDEYHTRIGGEVYHICQYAELLERGGAVCHPEPENAKEETAWNLGRQEHLAAETFSEGFSYSLYGKGFQLIDAGRLYDPTLSMNEARDEILAGLKRSSRTCTETSYKTVLEMAARAESRQWAEDERPSALKQLSSLSNKNQPEPRTPASKRKEVERCVR